MVVLVSLGWVGLNGKDEAWGVRREKQGVFAQKCAFFVLGFFG